MFCYLAMMLCLAGMLSYAIFENSSYKSRYENIKTYRENSEKAKKQVYEEDNERLLKENFELQKQIESLQETESADEDI